jgi:hypothetical protein
MNADPCRLYGSFPPGAAGVVRRLWRIIAAALRGASRRSSVHPGAAYLLAAVLALPAAAAEARFQIIYNTPAGSDEKDARAFIQDEGITGTVTEMMEKEFALNGQLTLFMGGGQRPGYDEVANEILMPYGFVFDIAARFERDDYSGTGADIYDVTRDAYLHALMHEIAHALFVMYDLRTSGSMEKAVDALAILLLIRYYENGGDIVINAAELFVDDSGGAATGSGAPDFWTEHRLDRQSYNQAICLVYGSDPGRFEDLRARSEFLQIRGRECVREYRRQADAWFRVLRQFMKRPPPG